MIMRETVPASDFRYLERLVHYDTLPPMAVVVPVCMVSVRYGQENMEDIFAGRKY